MSHSTWGSYCQLPSRHRPAILFPVPPRIKPHQRYIPAIALILQSIWRLKKKLGLLVVFFYLYFYLFSYLSLFYFPAILLFTPYWGVASKYATSFEKKTCAGNALTKNHISHDQIQMHLDVNINDKTKNGEIMAKCVRFVCYSAFLLYTQPQLPNGKFFFIIFLYFK